MEFPNFIGTFYSNSNNSSALLENPDTVIGYIPKGTNEMVMHTEDGEVYDWWIVNDVSDWDNSVLYSAFAGSDNPFSYAHNETITDGSAVLVIKDSYGNAFIPWLVDHYEYIYWIDARYTDNTILQMVEDYGIDDVIYEAQIYNCSSEYMQGRYLQIGS
ncbi:MAG: hypothetical protein HUJ65_07175, partial [Oscillospiraceae bacterium]|nr:hypothetical protein [Oscillospiraceae bacterium]